MARNNAVLIGCLLAALATADGRISESPQGTDFLHQALESLARKDYTSAEQQGQALATLSHSPDERGWLIAASARQYQKNYTPAIDAYKRFLTSNSSAPAREFAVAQIARCYASLKEPQAVVPPSKNLLEAELTELAKVEDTIAIESSEHFVVKSRNARLSKIVVAECESLLVRVCGSILAGQEFPHRVEINIWPDAREFHANVRGEPDWAGGSFSISKTGGAVVRRIDLTQLSKDGRFSGVMLDKILPHELCHLVTREYFGDASIPLFLNEGLAMLAESQTDVDRTLLAGSAVSGKEKIPLENLLTRQLPGKQDVTVFYAESQSFTEFLRARLTDQQFGDFLSHLKSGCTVSDALERALYVSQSDSFMSSLAAAWEDYAIQHSQLIRILRGNDLSMAKQPAHASGR